MGCYQSQTLGSLQRQLWGDGYKHRAHSSDPRDISGRSGCDPAAITNRESLEVRGSSSMGREHHLQSSAVVWVLKLVLCLSLNLTQVKTWTGERSLSLSCRAQGMRARGAGRWSNPGWTTTIHEPSVPLSCSKINVTRSSP